MKAFTTAVFLACALLQVSCSGDSASSASPDSTGGGGAVLNPTTSPFYVSISGYYEGTNIGGVIGDCYYESTDPLGSALKTCTIRVPELTLHYSDLTFTVGTSSATTCEMISFTPFYYLRSEALKYTADEIDCTKHESKKCWGGAGPSMIEGWPAVGGSYFLPVNQLKADYKLKSSNSRGLDPDEGSYTLKGMNVDVANMMPLADQGTTVELGVSGGRLDYIKDTWQDYYFSCRDKWANTLYSIKIKIADDDTVTATHDDTIDYFFDWDDP